MIIPNKSNSGLRRSGMFVGLGIRLAGIGTVVVAMYFFLVAESPIQGLRESLSWVVPVGVSCWIVAVAMFAAGVVIRSSESEIDSLFSPSVKAAEGAAPDTGSLRDLLGVARLEVGRRFPDLFHLEWTPSLIEALDGKSLVNLAIAYFRAIGFRARPTYLAQQGVDVWLFEEGEENPVGAVQCLPVGAEAVGVELVREFYCKVAAKGIDNGVMLTAGTFSEEAVNFAAGNTLELISGEIFLAKLAALPEEKSQELLLRAARGKWEESADLG